MGDCDNRPVRTIYSPNWGSRRLVGWQGYEFVLLDLCGAILSRGAKARAHRELVDFAPAGVLRDAAQAADFLLDALVLLRHEPFDRQLF